MKRKGLIKFLIWFFIIYGVFSFYHSGRFYMGSSINNVNVTGKTVEEAKDELNKEIQNYALTIVGRDEEKEVISGKDIEFKYDFTDEDIEELKDEEGTFSWINSVFTNSNYEINKDYSFNEALLSEKINSLDVLKDENQVAPKNPQIVYKENGFIIEDGNEGQKIIKEKLEEAIYEGVKSGKKVIDLEELECYEKPQYTKDSEEVINAKKTIDIYMSSSINFKFVDKSKLINDSVIKDWIVVDENFNVSINESKVIGYVGTITAPYSTVGRTRDFKASSGNVVKVVGGDYGRGINNSQYASEIISAIKEGSTCDKEYNVVQGTANGGGSDIGDTYVEINLTKQHIWFYKNGQLLTEGPIVTGDSSRGWATPQGTYKLKYKTTDVVLRGPGYASPVTFWMPFNGGIGLHDASWRDTFGGAIYKNNGSHGCVNLQYKVAQTIYNNISAGDPIVCYFE